jgi:hypothetical protein
MKPIVLILGVALGALVAVAPVRAQYCCYPYVQQGPAPYCWYQQNSYGQWYGPNCYFCPPYPPFQGMVFAPPRPYQPGMVAVPGGPPVPCMPGQQGYGGTVAFPSHQWARSPRDFFMVN